MLFQITPSEPQITDIKGKNKLTLSLLSFSRTGLSLEHVFTSPPPSAYKTSRLVRLAAAKIQLHKREATEVRSKLPLPYSFIISCCYVVAKDILAL